MTKSSCAPYALQTAGATARGAASTARFVEYLAIVLDAREEVVAERGEPCTPAQLETFVAAVSRRIRAIAGIVEPLEPEVRRAR